MLQFLLGILAVFVVILLFAVVVAIGKLIAVGTVKLIRKVVEITPDAIKWFSQYVGVIVLSIIALLMGWLLGDTLAKIFHTSDPFFLFGCVVASCAITYAGWRILFR